QVALLEKFSEINPESTCLSGRDLVLLSVLQNERRASVETEVASCRQFIVNELNDLNVPVSEELISELEAALAAKGLDFMKKPVAAKIEILETVIRLSRATETETAAPAAQNPESTGMEGEPQEMPAAPPALAPARVSAYGEKGFQINASHVRAIMDSEGISEKKARAYMGAIVYGYKLGSSKPAIGNVYFNTNAVQKNLRAVAEIAELGLRPLNVIKFLAKRGVVSVRKSGDTSSLNFHTADMEEPWKALMVEIFRQHQRITGNGN
ncbi:MAG TPA: hypothetical protein PKJ97_02905, partial [Candidatus Bilamarchaeaceae archaeon]|nr:hypothetical protein [Candidatus Bilamarchaeaceae archaeon]